DQPRDEGIARALYAFRVLARLVGHHAVQEHGVPAAERVVGVILELDEADARGQRTARKRERGVANGDAVSLDEHARRAYGRLVDACARGAHRVDHELSAFRLHVGMEARDGRVLKYDAAGSLSASGRGESLSWRKTKRAEPAAITSPELSVAPSVGAWASLRTTMFCAEAGTTRAPSDCV